MNPDPENESSSQELLTPKFWRECVFIITKHSKSVWREHKNLMLHNSFQRSLTKMIARNNEARGVHSEICQDEITFLALLPFIGKDVQKGLLMHQFFKLSEQNKLVTTSMFYKDDNEKNIKLIGMDNWKNVLCYIDALLFAMFARMDDYDQYLLYNQWEHLDKDIPRKTLLKFKMNLRLVISLLRSGQLVSKEIMQLLCHNLADLGFPEALSSQQNDTAFMFAFLAEILQIPLLTLRIDIIHKGRFDIKDDLKFIQERCIFLSVSQPDPDDESNTVTLDDCLSDYFNSNIKVKRHLQRRKTLVRSQSMGAGEKFPISRGVPPPKDFDDGNISEYEDEISEFVQRGVLKRTFTDAIIQEVTYMEPTLSREESIVSSSSQVSPKGQFSSNTMLSTASIDNFVRNVQERANTQTSYPRQRSSTLSTARPRDGSVSNFSARESSFSEEVSLPAWMFLQLLPFHTEPSFDFKKKPFLPLKGTKHNPYNFDINRKLPLVPICLKRYMEVNGKTQKNKTKIIIPTVISSPYFISEDDTTVKYNLDSFNPHKNFKLVLQSCVCHRGSSINSGHYVSLVRKYPYVPGREESAIWELFNDTQTGEDKTVEISFQKAVEKEEPYLLFYRIEKSNSQEDLQNGAESNKVAEPPLQNSNSLDVIAPEGSKVKFWSADSNTENSTRKHSIVSDYTVSSTEKDVITLPNKPKNSEKVYSSNDGDQRRLGNIKVKSKSQSDSGDSLSRTAEKRESTSSTFVFNKKSTNQLLNMDVEKQYTWYDKYGYVEAVKPPISVTVLSRGNSVQSERDMLSVKKTQSGTDSLLALIKEKDQLNLNDGVSVRSEPNPSAKLHNPLRITKSEQPVNKKEPKKGHKRKLFVSRKKDCVIM
ncbi:BA75_00533T0 [Komagataella pastoris]|uniref:BA75_00533T0 n=1 Tax=Komagataella pastoris TaxID=4922 RepID=A0A1B2J760_PICPA|nr:BA75_00533T0 [Komagataella pastoris]